MGSGRLLITERSTKRLLLLRRGKLRRVAYAASTVWASGETGLMSLAVDPAFARTAASTPARAAPSAAAGTTYASWPGGSDASRAARFLVRRCSRAALHLGSHGGCRLLIASNGAMFVGTGDAAVGTNPRNLNSLGGKTLRLNRFTGAPWPQNPWIGSASRNARYVLTFGHRNVQGLAQRLDGSVWSVEHGPDRDDEVNRLITGGDYGWNPVPGYNESVPMTDHSLPGTQVSAPLAVRLPHDRDLRSGLGPRDAVGPLQRHAGRGCAEGIADAVHAVRSGRQLQLRTVPAALRRYGRLRSVTPVGKGDLLVTTANGGSRDYVLRVHPRG